MVWCLLLPSAPPLFFLLPGSLIPRVVSICPSSLFRISHGNADLFLIEVACMLHLVTIALLIFHVAHIPCFLDPVSVHGGPSPLLSVPFFLVLPGRRSIVRQLSSLFLSPLFFSRTCRWAACVYAHILCHARLPPFSFYVFCVRLAPFR